LAGWLGDGVVGWLVGWSQGAKESPFSTDGKVKKINIYATLGEPLTSRHCYAASTCQNFHSSKGKLLLAKNRRFLGLGKCARSWISKMLMGFVLDPVQVHSGSSSIQKLNPIISLKTLVCSGDRKTHMHVGLGGPKSQAQPILMQQSFGLMINFCLDHTPFGQKTCGIWFPRWLQ